MAKTLGREAREDFVVGRGAEIGVVNATFPNDERGVRGTAGDATFMVVVAVEGVIGVRGT